MKKRQYAANYRKECKADRNEQRKLYRVKTKVQSMLKNVKIIENVS